MDIDACPSCGGYVVSKRLFSSDGADWGCDTCGYEWSDKVMSISSPLLHLRRKNPQPGQALYAEAAMVAAEEMPEQGRKDYGHGISALSCRESGDS
jgi:hypothetical protein